MRLCYKTSSDMLSGIWRRTLTYWGGRKSRIGVAILEECLCVIDFLSAVSTIFMLGVGMLAR